MSKKKNTEIHKLYCISQLLLESLDELKPTSAKMVKFKADLIGLCELMNDDVSDTAAVQKSIYFQEMTHKINCIVRKQFDNNM
jgi:hypothetical protein